MALDPDRRAALDGARARALVERAFAETVSASVPLPGGIGLSAGSATFVHLLEPGARAFGAAEIWVNRQPAERVVLVVDDYADPGAAARRAAASVRRLEVFGVVGEEVSPATPVPLAEPGAVPAELQDLAGRVSDLGLDVVFDHGEVVVECVGLEVGRLVSDGGVADLEAGVGSFDREANRVLHPDDTAWDTLLRVVDEVRRWRRRGALDHPLGRLAREAWLAHEIRGQVGGEDLRRLMPTVPRSGIRREGPVALLRDEGGSRTVVLTTVGSDVSLPAIAADHLMRDRADRLEVVVPAGGVHGAVHDLQGRLSAHCAITEIAPPWGP